MVSKNTADRTAILAAARTELQNCIRRAEEMIAYYGTNPSPSARDIVRQAYENKAKARELLAKMEATA